MSTAVQRQEREAQILDAAATLFSEEGFAGVSMRDVASRAGLGKALVFYYFGSKDALFVAVLERYYAAHRRAFEDTFTQQAPLRDHMHGALDAYLDFIEDNRLYPGLVQHVVTSSPEHRELVARNLHGLYAFVEHALRGVAPEHGPLAARHVFVTLSGAVIQYFTYASVLAPVWGADPLADEGVAERRAHLHWLVDLMVDGLERAAG